MRIENSKINELTKAGSVMLTPEDEDDIWELYNLIGIGDVIKSRTTRKVKSTSSADVVTISKKVVVLSLKVSRMDYDGEDSSLRISGTNLEENEFVALGARHTFDIKEHTVVTLSKEYWDSIFIDKLRELSKKSQTSQLYAIVLQEGLANICIVRNSMCIVKGHIETTIPGKGRGGSAQSQKAMTNFFSSINTTVLKLIDFTQVKVILVCSSGYLNQQLVKYMDDVSLKGDRIVHANLSKFVCLHTSSGNVHSLKEVLKDEKVLNQLNDVQFAEEVAILSKFEETFRLSPDRVAYGEKFVTYCLEQGAIETLLISDKLIRGKTAEIRRRIISIMDGVKEAGGKTYMFSSLHPSGEQLNNLTGIAAILRFPVEEVFDSESSEGEMVDED